MCVCVCVCVCVDLRVVLVQNLISRKSESLFFGRGGVRAAAGGECLNMASSVGVKPVRSFLPDSRWPLMC